MDLLPPAEEQAYRLVVKMAGAGVDEFAARAAIAPEQARTLLEALRRRGLVTAGPIYRALPPDVALGEVLLREQEHLETARHMVAALSEEYRSNTRWRSTEHLMEIVVGAPALRERLRDLQDSAKQEILWFCRANPIAMHGPENTEETPALTRGVALSRHLRAGAAGETGRTDEHPRGGRARRTSAYAADPARTPGHRRP